MRRMRKVAAVVLACSAGLAAQSAEELNFTSAIPELRELPRALHNYMSAEARKHLTTRPRLTSAVEVKQRAEKVREHMLASIGGLPERTPLNARTVGVVDRPAYRIEKVVFESQPKFFVTANLYIPKNGSGPWPAILFPLGHEAGAKAHDAWQYALASFATKGFVALPWDPLGQGERSQFYDPETRRSRMVQSTREHTMLGAQTLLVGESVARYTIFDGIRALDYLASRKEVDPKRIGVTGNSGGGTHTAYLAALDDRLQVAAPSCYITSWDKLMPILGPQDAEQNLPPWINLGFDFPDFLYAFSLKPYLVLSAVRDFFPIGGARATFAEVRRVYDSAGVADKLKMVEADDGHGYTLPRRLAAYQWFSKWLKGVDDDGVEPPVQLASEAELQCTPTGQVSTSLEGETVFSLNRKRAEQVRGKTPDPVTTARRLSGFTHTAAPVNIVPYGTVEKPGYRLEKFTYESEPGIVLPAVLAIPAKPSGTALIYADGRGKSAAATRLDGWMKEGIVVLAVDLRGMGENLAPAASEFAREHRDWLGDSPNAFAAMLLGRTLVGMRAQDIARALDVLQSRPDLRITSVRALGVGRAGIATLLATAFDSRIDSAELERMLVSYRAAVESRLHRGVMEDVIPGVIRHFDLPDLVAALGPRIAKVTDSVDALGDPVRPASR
jgi:cephalosporin-C deacetylase-like acetyl esterase